MVSALVRSSLLGVALAVLPLGAASAQSGSRRALRIDGPNPPIDYTIADSGRPGPTVLVVGGVHGNEPAGARAARQIAGWQPVRGRLVVVERANPKALQAGVRRTPDLPRALADLDRQFPSEPTRPPHGERAAALWRLVEELRPDLLLDLHEGYDFTRRNPDSVGSSVIADRTAATRRLAQRMIEAVDVEIDQPDHEFTLKSPPVDGSLARAAQRRLGVGSMILETTSKRQALPLRARQHRILVHRALVDLGMVSHGPHVVVGGAAASDQVRVAMYAAAGVSGRGPARLEELLTADRGFVLRRLCAADVRDGVLEQFDVAIFPGGSKTGQARALGAEGRTRVRDFVGAGGGYVGLCAGTYLAAANYRDSLHILDADVIDRAHWARGRGDVPVEFTAAGRDLGGPEGRPNVLYANGPILAPAGLDELPDYRVLALFRGEVAKAGAPSGVMPGTPAIVAARFGAGRVVCSSPHPEQSEGLGDVVRGMVRCAAGRQPAAGVFGSRSHNKPRSRRSARR